MMRKWTLLFACLLGFLSASRAQLCGTDAAHQQLLQNDPAYAARYQQHQLDWAQYTAALANSLIVNTPQGPVYEIPVVVHVMHTGGAVGTIYNPRTDSIISMINYLNAAYATTWAPYPDSLNGGTRIPVRFALARRDPNCNSTDGIIRVDCSSNAAYVANGVASGAGPGVTDVSIKALSIWPNTRYYNIWVVNKINGQDGTSGSFTAGFAYYPGANANVDGTVMLATQTRSNRITLVHEIGHAFNLRHTFDGDNNGASCPANGNCNTDGDQICDTEPHIRPANFACITTGINTCNNNAPYGTVSYNFMNYTNCQNRFTTGQRTRFMFALLNYRPELISSLGTVPPPTSPVITASCVPTITNPANTSDAGPREVTIADMTAITGGYNTDGNQVYIDRTCQSIAHMSTGQTYSVSVETGGSAQRVRIWIDYNHNGVFTDANELVYSHDGTVNGTEVHTGTFTVPATGVSTCTPLRMRVAADRSVSPVPGSCSAYGYGQAEDYQVEVRGSGGTAAVSIALTTGTNPSCTGSQLTFTATPTGNPAGPSYLWFINGASTGVTGSTYTSSTLTTGQTVTARLYYASTCGVDSATSNGITIQRSTTVAPSVTIALTSGSNPGCPGQSLTFTATPVSGGTAPTYQWKVNNVVQTGATGSTYTTSILSAGDVVSATLISNLPCASPTTANSNGITITFTTLTASVSVAITGGSNPVCSGRPVTFTATPTNGGTAPTLTWNINGAPNGVTGPTFTTSSLQNGAAVSVLMVSNNPCVTSPVVTSAPITMTVIPTDTPKVSISVAAGSNPGCLDSLLTLQASSVNMGVPPVYTWYLNSTQAAVGNTYSGTAFANGDVITVRAITGGPGCRTSDTVFSAPLALVRTVAPPAPLISWMGGSLSASVQNVQWYGPSGLIPGATYQTYWPSVPGYYYAVTTNIGCGSKPSNLLLVQNVSVKSYRMDQLTVYPNPSSGRLELDWKSAQPLAKVSVYALTGQQLLTETCRNVSHKVLDLSALAAGSYFLVLQDEKGATGTTRITIAR